MKEYLQWMDQQEKSLDFWVELLAEYIRKKDPEKGFMQARRMLACMQERRGIL